MEGAFVLSGVPCTARSRGAVSMRLGAGGRGSGKKWRVGGVGKRSLFGKGSGGGAAGSDGSDGLSGNGGGRGTGGTNDAGAGGSRGPLGSFWASYNTLLARRPIFTKALTSLVGFSLGDILAQKFLSQGEPFDSARLLRMALFGFCFHGPTGHYFYGFLDRSIVGTTAPKVATKVAIDQLLWAPIFTACFFTFLGVTEGKAWSDIKRKLDNDLSTAVQASWKVWPIVHAINFRFIPSSQRLLYINTIQVAYNMFLSIIGNRGTDEAVAK